jgi:hypothetical protein
MELLYSFEAFNITFIPRCQNVVADTLVNVHIDSHPLITVFLLKSFLGLLYRITSCRTNWRVFNNDTQIINFLTNSDVFQDSVIDDEVHQQNLRDYWDEASKVKANCIPRNVLSLEKLFDLRTKFRKHINPKMNNSTMMHFQVNLGTTQIHQSGHFLFRG